MPKRPIEYKKDSDYILFVAGELPTRIMFRSDGRNASVYRWNMAWHYPHEEWKLDHTLTAEEALARIRDAHTVAKVI